MAQPMRLIEKWEKESTKHFKQRSRETKEMIISGIHSQDK